MEKLLKYINSMKKEEQSAFAVSVGTTIGQMRKAIYIGQKLSPKVCVKIEKETKGQITRADLYGDEAHLFWPDLPACAGTK